MSMNLNHEPRTTNQGLRGSMLTKIDKFIIAAIIIAALASFPLAMSASSSANGSKLAVYRDGKKIISADLGVNKSYKIKGQDGGYCILQIKNSEARIVKSTCPQKICQKQGRVSQGGQTIICAPMRLMYKIESQSANSLDAVNE